MISSITNTATNPTTTATAAEPALANATADFETFLQLLTAEIRFQDPLEPVDSTQFVSQLASFSAVEQQLKTNVTLEEIAAQISAQSFGEEAAWLGRSARFEGPVMVSESGVNISFENPLNREATVEVIDNAGTVVEQLTLPAQSSTLTWVPKAETQTPANYRFERLEDDAGSRSLARVEDMLTELRLNGSGTVFVTASGVDLPATAVLSLLSGASQNLASESDTLSQGG